MQRLNRKLNFIPPMECRPTHRVPEGEGWQYELKFDGYRLQAIKNNGDVHLFSRNGNDFDERFPAVLEAVRALRAKEIVLDGELVAIDAEGRHAFNLLQKRSREPTLTHFYVFDLLVFEGKEMLKRPLHERRRLLEAKVPMPAASLVRLSPVLNGPLEEILAQIRKLGFEGIIAKQRDSIYVPGEETGTWLKHKLQQSDEFVIGGYIGSQSTLNEILVGRREAGGLVFVESVKNGFVPATRTAVLSAIKAHIGAACPFVNLPEKKGPHRMDRQKMKKVHWVEPQIVVEIAFNEATPGGHLRHSRFVRLREKADLRKGGHGR